MSWLVLLSGEIGVWFGWLGTRMASRDRTKTLLIDSGRERKAFGPIDWLLAQDTVSATKAQRKTAAGLTRGVRYLTQTRAFEFVVLKQIQEKWPGFKQQPVEVKLHL